MARQEVEQVQCDRCKRVELQPKTDAKKEKPDFHAEFMGKTLSYHDLCPHCRKTLDNIWVDITEWNRQLSQRLLGEEQAAPLTVAPDYTPPKPHAAAAAKR